MNKAELIATVAEKTGLSKKDSEKAVNATFDTITANLEVGEKVQLPYRPQPQDQGRDRDPGDARARLQGRQSAQGRCFQISDANAPGLTRSVFHRRMPMRLDKYLKVSRLIKRRTVANDACDGQHITVNGRTAKASYDVKVGDVIEIAFGQRTVKVEVLAVTENAKKDDAAAMYRELAE